MTSATKIKEPNPANPAAYSIPEAGRILGGLCHMTVYRLINSGKLRSFTVGRRRLIAADAIGDYIAQAERETAGESEQAA